MTSSTQQPLVQLIDTEQHVLAILSGLRPESRESPSMFIDLEGIKLGRHGTISILSIYEASHDIVYLIDVHSLGDKAFTTGSPSLQDILQDPNVAKVIFDVRNDSDAMFKHFGVKLAGVQDLQLMELAQRRGSKRLVKGLAKCVEQDSGLPATAIADWKLCKDRGRRLFAPELGGHYEVFNERPLRNEIKEYCAQDVVIMKHLYSVYNGKLNSSWRNKMLDETRKRIQQSQSANYNPQSRDNALGPWRSEQRTYSTDDYDELHQDTARDCDGWEDDMIKSGDW